MDSLDNLERDVKLCLAFLIANQDKWTPRVNIHLGGGQTRVTPVTLIGDIRE